MTTVHKAPPLNMSKTAGTDELLSNNVDDLSPKPQQIFSNVIAGWIQEIVFQNVHLVYTH